MALEISVETAICSMCGLKYGKRKGYFAPSLAECHKGTGTLHICRTCMDGIYNNYLGECADTEMAARQTCRKLDIYWNETLFRQAVKQTSNRTAMSCYLTRVKAAQYAGKSYDDTLREEDTLWNFGKVVEEINTNIIEDDPKENDIPKEIEEVPEIPEETKIFWKKFWGTGYTTEMYAELDARFQYWMDELPNDCELDIGTKAIIRQICSLELDINRDRAAGKPIDKTVNSLNTLLGSANLKPAQRKDESVENELANTPLGVWLWKYENKRPLPEIDKDLQDVNNIKKYIFTWMGHVSKMLGLKNTYTKLYEEEVERLRVEKPEYHDEDEETLLIDAYSEDGGM